MAADSPLSRLAEILARASARYVPDAYASGDMATNLIPPFWAIPLLG